MQPVLGRGEDAGLFAAIEGIAVGDDAARRAWTNGATGPIVPERHRRGDSRSQPHHAGSGHAEQAAAGDAL